MEKILSIQSVNIGEFNLSIELVILLISFFSVSLIFMLLSNIYINRSKSENYVLASIITTFLLLFALLCLNKASGIACLLALMFSLVSAVGNKSYKNRTVQIGGSALYYLCMIMVAYSVF